MMSEQLVIAVIQADCFKELPMSQAQLKYIVFPAVLALLLHLNYQSGFVPEKDFWTIAGIVAPMLGFDLEKYRSQQVSKGS